MEATDPTVFDIPKFRSPKHALARSFYLSRNSWKQKAQERSKSIKALQVRVRDLEVSRELWKSKASHLQVQLRQIDAGVAELATEVLPVATEPEELASSPRHDSPSIPSLDAESLPPRDAGVCSFRESVRTPLRRSAAAENPGEKKRRRR